MTTTRHDLTEGHGTHAEPSSHRATGTLVAVQILSLVGAAGANVLAARTLGPSRRGELAFLFQIAFVVAIVLLQGHEKSLAVTSAPGVTLQGNLASLRRSLSRNLLVMTVVGAAVTVVLWVTTSLSPLLIALVGAMAVAAAINRAFQAASTVASRMATMFSATVISQFVLLGFLAILAVQDNRSVPLWLVCYVLTLGLPFCAAWWRYERNHRPPPSEPATTETLRRVGRRLFPASLANYTVLRADRLIIPLVADTRTLGLYVVAATITESISWPVQAYADVAVGRWRRTGAYRTELRRALLVTVGYGAAAVALAIVLTHLLLRPVFGSSYSSAEGLVIPLSIAAFFYAFGRVTIAGCLAYQWSREVSALETTGMAMSLVVYLWAIPRYGAAGAALGSIIGYGTSALGAGMLLLVRRSSERKKLLAGASARPPGIDGPEPQ